MLQKTKVLIIGAGPTGLMAACQLHRQGIEPVIIDRRAGTTQESKALVLQARTLEIYDQLGIANEALLKGELVQKIQFIVKGKKVQEIPLHKIGEGASPFPFLLILEQSKNEELLYTNLKKLGGEVAWETEMMSILCEEDKAIIALKNSEGAFDIEADYVIAADGSSSGVREVLEVSFIGNTNEQNFYVADAAVNWQWGSDAVSVYVSKKTFVALFPMQGKDRFRVVGVLPTSLKNEAPQSFDQIEPIIKEQLEEPVQFSDVTWFSEYNIQHRCLEHFIKGVVFFAGDAAHMHSPAGGQGMNAGLGDAYNIAWKLALVIKGFAHPCLLDTYEQERLPFAKSLMASTDRAFGMLTSTKWFYRLLRLGLLPKLVPLVLRIKSFRHKAFRSVSQTGNKYINSDLTINRTLDPLTIKAGERFPYFTTKSGDSLYHAMKNSVFHALVFTASKESKLVKEMKALESEMGKLVQVHNYSNEESLCAALKIKNDVVIVVRPDHYIGLITDEGTKVVADYLRRLGDEKKVEGVLLTKTHP